MLAAGEAAEEAGPPAKAAEIYANAVEVASRMAGISGRFEEADLRGGARTRRTTRPRSRSGTQGLASPLDHGWIPWSFGREEEMAGPIAEGLALAREVDEPLLLSSALDGAASTSWTAGRFKEAVAMNRERLDVLERLPASPGRRRRAPRRALRGSRSRSFAPASLHEALRWDQINASEIAKSYAPYGGGPLDPAAVCPRRVGHGARAWRGDRGELGSRGPSALHSVLALDWPRWVPSMASVATRPACRDWVELAEEVASDSPAAPRRAADDRRRRGAFRRARAGRRPCSRTSGRRASGGETP